MNLLVLVPTGCNVKLLEGYSKIFDKVIVLGQRKYKGRFDFLLRQSSKYLTNVDILYSWNKIDYVFRALRILNKEKIDVIISQDPYSSFYNVLLKKFKGCKGLFLMCQDFLEYLKVSKVNFLTIFMNKVLLKFSCRNLNVLALSNYIRDRVISYGAKKVDVIPIYGIDTDLFYPKNKDILRKRYNIKGKILLTVARLSPEKGIEVLLKSFKDITKDYGLYLFIIGIGPLTKRLIDLTYDLGIDNRVFFIGWVDNYKLNDYYNSCDVFILPSFKEGLGFVLGEAMACQKPVIASRVGGIPDLINDGKTGLLFNPEDVIGLRELIIKLLKDKDLYDRLSKNGREFIIKNYSEKIVFNRLKKYLLD